MDLARAPRRARLTARKKGSGYENAIQFDQFRLIFKGNKSLEYCCLVIHLTSVSTISYAESNGVAFFSKYIKAAQPNV